jgi:hypothetical protein
MFTAPTWRRALGSEADGREMRAITPTVHQLAHTERNRHMYGLVERVFRPAVPPEVSADVD